MLSCTSNGECLDLQTGDRLVKVMGFLTDLQVYTLIYQDNAARAKSRILNSESETKVPKSVKAVYLGSAVPFNIKISFNSI